MHCLDCGYNLQHLTEDRCPECGRVFEPRNPETWGAPLAARFRMFATMAGWVAAIIPALLGVYLTYQMAIGHDDRVALLLYWMLLAVPLGIALVMWLGFLAASKRAPSRRAMIATAVLALLHLSLFLEWPADAAFLLMRSSLNQHVQQAQAGNAPTQPIRIGAFRVDEIGVKTMANGKKAVIFKIGGGSGPDHLVHGMTDAEIEANFNIWSYRRINEDWHIVHED